MGFKWNALEIRTYDVPFCCCWITSLCRWIYNYFRPFAWKYPSVPTECNWLNCLQFKLDPRLARLLGVHTQTRPVIISALWQYIKTHKLQDTHEREFINCDKYLEQIFACSRMKFAEIPQRLNPLLHPPDPIVINHVISVEGKWGPWFSIYFKRRTKFHLTSN